jgi:EAL domain-containing protein (putative c-di-GMP-specific phosphodiesterase class I)
VKVPISASAYNWRRLQMTSVPIEFTGIAERIGQIKALGNWVLKTACTQAAAWRDMRLPGFRMAVNISPTHFQDPAIGDSGPGSYRLGGREPRAGGY